MVDDLRRSYGVRAVEVLESNIGDARGLLSRRDIAAESLADNFVVPGHDEVLFSHKKRVLARSESRFVVYRKGKKEMDVTDAIRKACKYGNVQKYIPVGCRYVIGCSTLDEQDSCYNIVSWDGKWCIKGLRSFIVTGYPFQGSSWTSRGPNEVVGSFLKIEKGRGRVMVLYFKNIKQGNASSTKECKINAFVEDFKLHSFITRTYYGVSVEYKLDFLDSGDFKTFWSRKARCKFQHHPYVPNNNFDFGVKLYTDYEKDILYTLSSEGICAGKLDLKEGRYKKKELRLMRQTETENQLFLVIDGKILVTFNHGNVLTIQTEMSSGRLCIKQIQGVECVGKTKENHLVLRDKGKNTFVVLRSDKGNIFGEENEDDEEMENDEVTFETPPTVLLDPSPVDKETSTQLHGEDCECNECLCTFEDTIWEEQQ